MNATDNHAAIRERLAKCPSFGHKYEAGPIATGCAHCGLNRWAHWYAEDVAALLARCEMATEFVINPLAEPHKWVLIRKCVGHRLPQPVMWKVTIGGWVLAKDGELEMEPQPSSRDDEFYQRCRFETFDEAMEGAKAALLAEIDGREDAND